MRVWHNSLGKQKNSIHKKLFIMLFVCIVAFGINY